jgi:hypothetical protein
MLDNQSARTRQYARSAALPAEVDWCRYALHGITSYPDINALAGQGRARPNKVGRPNVPLRTSVRETSTSTPLAWNSVYYRWNLFVWIYSVPREEKLLYMNGKGH